VFTQIIYNFLLQQDKFTYAEHKINYLFPTVRVTDRNVLESNFDYQCTSS